MLRIATTPAAWSNEDDRTLGAEISLDQCLSEAAEIGFEGIEFGHKFPTEPGDLTARLDQHGLKLAAAHHGLSLLKSSVEEERERLAPVIAMMKATGCETLIVKEVSNATFDKAEQPLSARPDLSAEEWDTFGLKLEQLATLLADEGITCVYHHYMGTVVQTPEEIDRLMMETGPNLHLLFDTAQCYMGGGDPAQVLTRHLPRVRHFHAGNIRVRELTRARMNDVSLPEAVRKGVFTVPGDRDGSVDFKSCINLLSASDYDGWVVVAAGQDPAKHAPGDTQKTGFQTISALVSGTGRAAA